MIFEWNLTRHIQKKVKSTFFINFCLILASQVPAYGNANEIRLEQKDLYQALLKRGSKVSGEYWVKPLPGLIYIIPTNTDRVPDFIRTMFEQGGMDQMNKYVDDKYKDVDDLFRRNIGKPVQLQAIVKKEDGVEKVSLDAYVIGDSVWQKKYIAGSAQEVVQKNAKLLKNLNKIPNASKWINDPNYLEENGFISGTKVVPVFLVPLSELGFSTSTTRILNKPEWGENHTQNVEAGDDAFVVFEGPDLQAYIVNTERVVEPATISGFHNHARVGQHIVNYPKDYVTQAEAEYLVALSQDRVAPIRPSFDQEGSVKVDSSLKGALFKKGQSKNQLRAFDVISERIKKESDGKNTLASLLNSCEATLKGTK